MPLSLCVHTQNSTGVGTLNVLLKMSCLHDLSIAFGIPHRVNSGRARNISGIENATLRGIVRKIVDFSIILRIWARIARKIDIYIINSPRLHPEISIFTKYKRILSNFQFFLKITRPYRNAAIALCSHPELNWCRDTERVAEDVLPA